MLNPAAVQAISTHLNSLSIGATAGPLIAAPLTQSDFRSATIGGASLGIALASYAATSEGASLGFGAAGIAVGAISLANNLDKISQSATGDGVVKKSDVSAAAADLAGVLAPATLVVAGAAASGALFPLAVGAVLVVTSITLTIEAQRLAQGEASEAVTPWETPEIKAMNDAAKKFLDEAGAAGKAISKALLDPAFWDEFAKQGAKLFEPLLDPLNEAANWLKKNLHIPQSIKDTVKTFEDAAKAALPTLAATPSYSTLTVTA